MKNTIVLCFVDDCLLLSQDNTLTYELFVSFQEGFTCADEGDTDGYLGAEIKTNKKNDIEVTAANQTNFQEGMKIFFTACQP